MSGLPDVSALLLAPVHVGIFALFVVAVFESGRLIVRWVLRSMNRGVLAKPSMIATSSAAGAFPIIRFAKNSPHLTVDDLDLEAMRSLEFIRIATRVTPMLGLIATLIPMGPALVALTRNDVTQMSELLRSVLISTEN
jgi:biopolymer transport protein ExbB/TolQ